MHHRSGSSACSDEAGWDSDGLLNNCQHKQHQVPQQYQQQVQHHGCPTRRSRFATVAVIVITVLDVFLLICLAGLEYLFRWTTIIPVRNQEWSCAWFTQFAGAQLTTTTYTNQSGAFNTFNNFYLVGDIPEIVIYIYSFSFPIVVVVVGELLLFCLANPNFKPLPSGVCSPMNIPHTIRRLYRFSITFLFGSLSVMVIVEILKIVWSVPRPHLLRICPAIASDCSETSAVGSNRSNSGSNNFVGMGGEVSIGIDTVYSLCSFLNPFLFKRATTSRPSMRTAISTYAALFVAVYLHGGIAAVHHSKYLIIPVITIATLMCSVLCGVQLVAKGDAWLADVLIGHCIGAAVSLYLTVVLQQCFQFQENVSKRRLLRQIYSLQSPQRRVIKRHISTENEPVTPFDASFCVLEEEVRLRNQQHVRQHHQSPPACGMCNPLTTNNKIAVRDGTGASTFVPVRNASTGDGKNQFHRKSVTLPISSPHVPNHNSQQQQQKPSQSQSQNKNSQQQPQRSVSHTANTLSNQDPITAAVATAAPLIQNRYSMVNLPASRRHLLLNRNVPRISQELIDLLNEKRAEVITHRNLINLEGTTENITPTSVGTTTITTAETNA